LPAFAPPKPKEFEIIRRAFTGRILLATMSSGNSDCVKLMFAGRNSSRSATQQNAASIAPAAPALAGALSDRRGALVALVFVGCLALAAAAFSAASARQRVADAAVARVASQAGVDEAQARAIVDQALRLSGLAISIEAGLFVVVGGGALTAAAGALPLLASRPVPPSDRADDASPTPGPAE
jgi:hypothetical protein